MSARRTMLLSEILKLAMDSFRAAKTRFVLTALGMVIGTASVILVVTIGMTGREYVLNLIQKFGTNSVEVEYAGGGATAAERVRYTDFLTRDTKRLSTPSCPASCIPPRSWTCTTSSVLAAAWSKIRSSSASARSISSFTI